MVQVPAETKVTVVPETVQTGVVAELNATVSELEAVAETENVPVPIVLLARELKVIVWEDLVVVTGWLAKLSKLKLEIVFELIP
jgi:hypothetical protein